MEQNTPSPCTVTARIRCERPELLANARQELARLAAATLAEPGCLAFTIHEEVGQPGAFVMWEVFSDVDAFHRHFTYPHTVDYVAQDLTTVVEHWVSAPLESINGISDARTA